MGWFGGKAIDKRVRREAKSLIHETRRGLRRHHAQLPPEVRKRLGECVDALAEAYQRDDPRGMRDQLPELDELTDQYLAFARKSTAVEYLESIAIAVMIALFLRGFVIEAFKIPSSSMVPTLEIGDHIFVNKFIFGLRNPVTDKSLFELRTPERGEVIVFVYPCDEDKDFIKRVVALAGDTVEVRCDILYVNGKAVPAVPAEHMESYWDVIEKSQKFYEQKRHRYYETQGDRVYSTFHGVNRPRADRIMRAARSDVPYNRFENEGQDFPQLEDLDGDDVRTGTGRIERRGIRRARKTLEKRNRDRGRLVDEYNAKIGTDAFVPWCDQKEGGERTPTEGRATVLGEYRMSDGGGEGPCSPKLHYVVPEGYLFAMGDHRSVSQDSRSWGPVPLENVKGKALIIWWSSKSAEAGGVSWRRVGKIVD